MRNTRKSENFPEEAQEHGFVQLQKHAIRHLHLMVSDLLNHMAVMVTARGKREAAEAMELLEKEYEENHQKENLHSV